MYQIKDSNTPLSNILCLDCSSLKSSGNINVVVFSKYTFDTETNFVTAVFSGYSTMCNTKDSYYINEYKYLVVVSKMGRVLIKGL